MFRLQECPDTQPGFAPSALAQPLPRDKVVICRLAFVLSELPFRPHWTLLLHFTMHFRQSDFHLLKSCGVFFTDIRCFADAILQIVEFHPAERCGFNCLLIKRMKASARSHSLRIDFR